MFDAGAIESRLTVDLSVFDRSLDRAENRVREFEKADHKVKISAVFDQSSMTQARKMFGDLDNSISKDAMSRLRSSPQGSVLGALNALFSPHPVSGAPSPSQAASQGLLGRMITMPGGGGPTPSPVFDNRTSPLATALTQDVTTTDTIRRQVTGAEPGNITTTDTIKEKVDPASKAQAEADAADSGNRSGASFARMFTSHLRNLLPASATGDAEKGAADSGDRAGGRWTVGFGSHLGPFFTNFHKTLSDEGGKGGASLGKGLLAGIGPGILGISAMFATKAGGIGAALAALPALGGIAGTGIGVALVGGITSVVVKGAVSSVQPLVAAYDKLQKAAPGPAQVTALANYNHQLALMSPAQRALAKSLETAQSAWQNFIKSNVAGVSTILSGGLGLLPGIIASMNGVFQAVVPQMASVFKSLGGVIQGLLGVAKTAVPAFAPFIAAILGLVSDLLPGISMVIKATIPFISQLAGVLGKLGAGLGGLFAAAAPAIGASMQVLSALLGLVSDLLPIIMQLADVFATALAPVFTVLVGAIKPLLPVLVTIAKVIADFAGAVIGDLAAAIGAIAGLFKAIGPSLATFANAIGGVFTVLENSGVFAELGNALENLAAPLGKMISALLDGLAPILPPVIKFVGVLAALIASTLSGAILTLLPPLTKLATDVLQSIATLLPAVLPLLTTMAGIFSTAVVAAIGGVATALSAIINAVPLPVITGLVAAFIAYRAAIMGIAAVQAVIGIIAGLRSAFVTMQIAYLIFTQDMVAGTVKVVASAIAQAAAWVASAAASVAAFVAMAAAATAAFIAENLATLGIIAGITALVAGIVYLATHWSQVWGEVKRIAEDAWNFIYNGFGKYLLPMLGPVGFLALGAIELSRHWTQIWGVIGGTVTTVLKAIEAAVKAAWGAIMTVTKVEWDAIAGVLKAVWAVISGAFKVVIALLTGNWTAANNAMHTTGVQVWNAIRTALGQIWNVIGGLARATWAAMAAAALAAWNGMRSTAEAVWGGIVGFFRSIPGRITGALKALAGDMAGVGRAAIAGLFGGITGALGNIAGWVNSNVVQPIIGAVKHFFGISSPSTVMAWIGGHLVGGLIKGLVTSAKGIGSVVSRVFGDMPHALLSLLEKGIGGITSLPGKAVSALKGLGGEALSVLQSLGSIATGIWDSIFGGGSGGGGVAQWKGVVDKALSMLGLPQSLEHNVLYQMKTESGGNPQAINLTDINAKNGTPSKGLMQVIGPTFAAYHVPGTSGDIYDPLANVAAALSYARARYGPTLMSGGQGIGSGHGYALGGAINEMVIGYGVNSGDRYTFGERGPEYVTPGGKPADSSAAVLARLDRLIAVASAIPAGVGDHVGGAIGGASQAASFRSRYPRGGS